MKPLFQPEGILKYKEQLKLTTLTTDTTLAAVQISKFLRKGVNIIKMFLTVFITRTYVFRPIRSDLSYNYPINSRYKLTTATPK